MRRFLFLCLVLFTTFFCRGQYIIPKKQVDTTKTVWSRYYFGLCFTPSHSDLITYAVIRIKPDGSREYKLLSKSSFIMQLTGQQASKANVKKENLLEKHEIFWQTFDDLWKLRYNRYPYEGSKLTGYTQHDFLPSEGQWNMLKAFGLEKFSDYCYGDSLFSLLKNMQNPAWVQQYSAH